MPPIEYLGEHRWIGYVLHAAVILGFLASANACISYFKAAKNEESVWKKYARWSFVGQGAMVWLCIGLMFYAMLNHYYEFEYVRHHISDDLPFKYVFAAFWEGQEGSFLLWMFWNVALGLILIKTSGRWESPAMGVFSLLQIFLFSMLLGLNVGAEEHLFKVGSSPSLLVRETFQAPIFQNPDYIKLIKGNGLNPLLQNYWMTIHPPTLFLGFASTIVPFLFAFAGWFKKDSKAWLKPAQEWALFSGFILGLGILMGGAWAYEALSFGGYWAWDPVENMSFVPWIMVVAGLHTNLIARSTGRAITATYLYYFIAFVLVLYSTYLTRSGVLGNTSAHAFTDMGLEWQLVLMLFVFIGVGVYQYFKNKKHIISPTDEDKINSREYWMFIGAMVLLFSSILITGATSLPVFNKIMTVFNSSYAGQVIVEPISHHNRYQLWIAILVTLISGLAEMLRYKEMHWDTYKKRFLKLISITLAISSILFGLTIRYLENPGWQHLVLQFAGIFAIVTNVNYLISFLRGNLKMAGSAMSHFGFGVMILGILATGLNKKIISSNLFTQSDLIEGFQPEDYMKNLMLLKGVSMPIKDFEVTYLSDTLLDPFNRTFNIRFDQKDSSGRTIKSINSTPNLVYGRNEGQPVSTNPSVYRTLTKDLYTYVNWLPPTMMNATEAEKSESNLKYKNHKVMVGDTIFISGGYGTIRSITNFTNHPDYASKPGDEVLGVNFEFRQLNDTNSYSAHTAIISRENLYFTLPTTQNDMAVKLKVNPNSLETFYPNDELGSDIELKENQQGVVDGYTLKFKGFDKNPSKEKYAYLENDIAVSTLLEVSTPLGKSYSTAPIFLIRKNQISLVHDYIFEERLRLSCVKIDPQKESVVIRLRKPMEPPVLEIDLAEKAPRNDLIVIQSIVFPGINLFWLGSLLMLGGLLLSGIRRWVQKN